MSEQSNESTEKVASKASSEKEAANVEVDAESSERAGTSFFAVMQSVGAAMIGVQSSKNKERDFTQGKPIHFIVGGLLGTLIFLLVIWLLVKYLLATS